MNEFNYRYPVTVHFGEKAAAKNLPAELAKVGKNVLLAYGGGSIKRNGIYDELMTLLTAAGKTVTEFSGIMSNPTYSKVQEGARLAKDNHIDFILAVGGGSVIDCCKVVSARPFFIANSQKSPMICVLSGLSASFPLKSELSVVPSTSHKSGKIKMSGISSSRSHFETACPEIPSFSPSCSCVSPPPCEAR